MYSPTRTSTEESANSQSVNRRATGPRSVDASPTVQSRCPNCGSVIPTVDVDEAVCPDCDVVVRENPISTNHPPLYDAETRIDRARAGGRVTFLYADKGIGVGIDTTVTTDGNGSSLSVTQRRVVNEKPWTKHQTADETRLDYALGEIRRMGGTLDVPDSELQTAARLYRKAKDEDLVVGRSVDGFATASVLVAVRQSSLRIPVSAIELEEVSRATADQIRNARSAMEVFLEVGVPPMDPRDFVPRASSTLSAPRLVRQCATKLLEAHKSDDNGRTRDFSPRTLAAAALHAAYEVVGVDDRPTLAELSEVMEVSVGTISDRKGYLMQYRGVWE